MSRKCPGSLCKTFPGHSLTHTLSVNSVFFLVKEASEVGKFATGPCSGSTMEKAVDASFAIEEAEGQPRRRDHHRHLLKTLSVPVGDALRLVLLHHRATLLWFVAMIINTFTTAIGALADESHIDCSAITNLTAASVALADVGESSSSCSVESEGGNAATPGSQAVFGLCLLAFVCVGAIVVVSSTYLDKWKGVKAWVVAHFTDMMIILAGTVYLAGANLSLVASLSVSTCVSIGDPLAMLTFRDIRNYLIAFAFLVSIIPDAFKKYWNVVTFSTTNTAGGTVDRRSNGSISAENGLNGTQLHNLPTQQQTRRPCKWPKLRYLILQALFQMLSYVVHLDGLYIIIQDEVSECDDDEEGRSCPIGFVTAGVVSFSVISFLWVGISSVLVCKYAHDLDTAKIKQRIRNKALGVSEVYSLRRHVAELCWTRKHLGLFLLWLVLSMYIPAYLALNNAWPWICIARCQLQRCEASNDGREERCAHYFNTRVILLFLFGLGTLALLLAYWCVVLLKETDREVEEEEEVVADTHNHTVQEGEDPGALNSSQGQSEKM